MPTNKVFVITKREYLSRIRTKGFWISTIALPVVMAAWMILPSLILSKSQSQLTLAVLDETGRVGPALVERLENPEDRPQAVDLSLELVALEGELTAQAQTLDDRVRRDEIDAWLLISEAGLEADELEYHGETVSNLITLEALERLVTRIVQRDRLAAAGYDANEVGELTRGIDLNTVRVSAGGTEADAGWGDLALAVGLFTILYMSIIIYGNMVMHGVLEEKSNRVVEVLVSSVRPWELMAGKMIGIASISLTQLTVWLVSAAVLTAPGLVTAFAAMPPEVTIPTLSLPVVAHFIALFLLGYTLYASFYALLGAAFNNPQEAQQLASFGVIFLVAPWMVFMPVLNDPDSTLSVVMSLVPVFTPLIMMLRIAVKMPPAWQLALGYVLTIGLDVFMVWLCARVYRVGILMYGKRPTLPELLRWARYR